MQKIYSLFKTGILLGIIGFVGNILLLLLEFSACRPGSFTTCVEVGVQYVVIYTLVWFIAGSIGDLIFKYIKNRILAFILLVIILAALVVFNLGSVLILGETLSGLGPHQQLPPIPSVPTSY